MGENEKGYPRRPPRLSRIFDQSPLYFVTFNTWQRRPLLANDAVHESFRGYAIKNKERGFAVGRYVIMPDHIHLFCSPTSKDSVSITNWASFWKRKVSLDFPDLNPIWQRDCWDTQLRAHESYTEKWSYMERNPVRAGLVDHPDKWLFKGTINHLPW